MVAANAMDEEQEEPQQSHSSSKVRESRRRKEDEEEKIGRRKPTFLGRHRISAAITHLNTQINTIQEELNELETVGESSIVCKELISSLETVPDPLLPTSSGAIDVNWDRWFRGTHNSKPHKRWI